MALSGILMCYKPVHSHKLVNELHKAAPYCHLAGRWFEDNKGQVSVWASVELRWLEIEQSAGPSSVARGFWR